MNAFQVQGSARSSNSNDSPSTFGICNGTHMWCKIVPAIQTLSYTVIPIAPGQAGIRINVGYDFPNNYCQYFDIGNACAGSLWPMPESYVVHQTRLQLFEGVKIYDVPAVFENGFWRPTIIVSCDGSQHTYTIRATNGHYYTDCESKTFVDKPLVVTFPASSDPVCRTPDLRPCPGCPAGGGL